MSSTFIETTTILDNNKEKSSTMLSSYPFQATNNSSLTSMQADSHTSGAASKNYADYSQTDKPNVVHIDTLAEITNVNCSAAVMEEASKAAMLPNSECCFHEVDIDTDVELKLKLSGSQGKGEEAATMQREEEEAVEEEDARGRSIRSNSCSQAEVGAKCDVASVGAAAAAAMSSIATSLTCVSHSEIPATSVSHENLTSTNPLTSSASVSNINLPQYSCQPEVISYETTDGSSINANVQQKQQQQQQESKQQSRFFSSKLNTGSLWSLLSNSSYTSETPVNDNMEAADGQQQDSSRSNVGFFNRVQFKRSNTQEQQVTQKSIIEQSKEQVAHERKRVRFGVKYVGSTILHKNFTLPMLEWIAKDIKRQTIRGAQSTSQRQFNIPAREIIFEIQANQLTAISCKDGHTIFVHPMHCVSKYAQLQHDPTCFSYLIRDTKESPYYCHVFQAKSASKVHDIFSAIREATTRSSSSTCMKPEDTSSLAKQTGSQFQKSLSTDAGSIQADRLSGSSSSIAAAQVIKPMQCTAAPAIKPAAQFEDSYQFEVMFVKKVKLQCRRVPPTFVDDALETLKSFEVSKDSKGSQMKGLGKRIISASVDERQEYDEACHSPAPQLDIKTVPGCLASRNVVQGEERRGSSVSLHRLNEPSIIEERESRSCQQSPTKLAENRQEGDNGECGSKHDENCCPSEGGGGGGEWKKYQSMECLKCIDYTIKSAKAADTPTYTNDFSPYNTITSSDLNERIAKIPVVSGSVSLDHETRQKLARQVRETIMATAANIKKNVYASGDKLDSSSSSKALDSLSCTVTSSVPLVDDNEGQAKDFEQNFDGAALVEQRRSSALANSICRQQQEQQSSQSANNFDLFRRASARQVIKNRTMLLLIGKDELCTISTDKHQMLFNKSFNSIVLCLQGNTNKDHFGLICRDSGKINPNAESYAGFIFKCHSDKVAREIMGALKQVIYNSQHNYHGYNSPYNPLNTKFNKPQSSPKLERANSNTVSEASAPIHAANTTSTGGVSLATKRGFLNSLDVDEAARLADNLLSTTPPTASYLQSSSPGGTAQKRDLPIKNIIKSMFCDNCPLYWYHRLCCDIESLPAEASKTIILRRIDSSLSEKEQDEVYSKFAEFNIDTIDEHNEIFMSLLRQLAEKKQLKHNQSSSHQSAMAKNSALLKQLNTPTNSATPRQAHQRSGSGSNSLAFVINQSNSANQSIADAGTAAIDNLKKAKNSISVSIENILKRRSSMKDEQDDLVQIVDHQGRLPVRAGSFKNNLRESRSNENSDLSDQPTNLQRSQSTTDYSRGERQTPNGSQNGLNWKGSLSNTLNREEISNQLVGLFSRRGSNSSKVAADADHLITSADYSTNNSSPNKQPGSPNTTSSRFQYSNIAAGSASPSSMLSSSFWKKSIFDKIRQPLISREERVETPATTTTAAAATTIAEKPQNCLSVDSSQRTKRSSAELRALWKKAILEQITLIKMDKQNQRLQANTAECDSNRIKLNYRDVPYNREVLASWDKLLKQDPTKKVEFIDVARLVRAGVPKQRRGEIWMFLMNQYQLRHGTSFQPADSDYRGDANQAYRTLLSRLSLQQHEIFVDIGRTFPTHPYYSQYLSIGQLSLFNLLKSYSLLDQEVGYCQGLSFVAGILLLHVESEDEAFELMRHLLFNFGLRKQYLPSMNALHLQLYQMTRLLRDYEFDLFNHFDHYDISPSLYAAPWFLTLFASQFPLSFVSRLLDLVFLIGIEAIFRVSLNLLAYHRKAILDCHSLESTMDYMRYELVKIVDDRNLVQMFDKSMSLDLRNKLIEYEIEYTFYLAEDKSKSVVGQNSSRMLKSSATGENSNTNVVEKGEKIESSVVADATATVIIQHLLANNHLKSLKSNYSY